MPTVKEYRRLAELCERIAAESSEKQEEAILRQIATQWRRLANIVKQMPRQETKNSD
jgi:uncharacterized heparinase superfamily protein